MKRKFTAKRCIVLLLAMVMTLSMMPITEVETKAASPARVTRDEAMRWLYQQADNRTAFDIDGMYGVQCSDFGTAWRSPEQKRLL